MLSFLKFGKAAEGENGKSRARLWLIILGASVGILLLVFGGNTSDAKKTEHTDAHYRTEEDEMLIYQHDLEARVEALCRSVKGVGNVTAIVTLSKGYESVYATEWKEGDEKYVIIGNGSNASALFLTRQAPEIAGIGVVCTGAESAEVRRELTALISATFHIPTNRIYIAQARS
jgi:hypothetical protein